MKTEPDYYAILQVDPLAEQEVIEAAYRRLARKYHPDVNKDSGATERMRLLNEAFETLGNPERRAEYDRSRGFARPQPAQGHSKPEESTDNSSNHSTKTAPTSSTSARRTSFRSVYILLATGSALTAILILVALPKPTSQNRVVEATRVATPTPSTTSGFRITNTPTPTKQAIIEGGASGPEAAIPIIPSDVKALGGGVLQLELSPGEGKQVSFPNLWPLSVGLAQTGGAYTWSVRKPYPYPPFCDPAVEFFLDGRGAFESVGWSNQGKSWFSGGIGAMAINRSDCALLIEIRYKEFYRE